MLKQLLHTFGLVALLASVAHAQTTPVPPAKDQEPARSASKPPDPAQLVNVRIELTILDQSGPGEPSKKLVTMHVADRSSASIRTSGRVLTKEGWRDVTINVDARPMVLRGKEGSVQIDLGLEYRPISSATAPGSSPGSQADASASQTGSIERISTILESGKPLLISQAADPSSDRRISVEMKATILK
jgi:hypothetical protein